MSVLISLLLASYLLVPALERRASPDVQGRDVVDRSLRSSGSEHNDLPTGRPNVSVFVPDPAQSLPIVTQTRPLEKPSTDGLSLERRFDAEAQRSPRAAAAMLDSPMPAETRARLLEALARRWAAADPARAINWAESLANTHERDTALTLIFSQISEVDPATAVRWRLSLSEANGSDAEIANLTQRWAEEDLTSVIDWVDSLPPGPRKDAAAARTAFVQAQRSPAEAARMVDDRIFDAEAKAEALLSVLHQWAHVDPLAARTWIEQMPAGAMRDRAVNELAAIGQSKPRD